MRRAARVDENQAAIVKALLQAGCGVVDLSAVGGGVPDLLVHPPTFPDCRMAVLLEIKNPAKPKADRALTPAQVKFHADWKGWLFVVTTVDEALAAVGVKL